MARLLRITLPIALGAGIVLGLLLLPAWRDARDLERLDDVDPVVRRLAWARVVDRRRDDGADTDLLARVRELSDRALADARQPLIELGAWDPVPVGAATFRRMIEARVDRDRVGDAMSVVIDFAALATAHPEIVDAELIARSAGPSVSGPHADEIIDAIAHAAWPDRRSLLSVDGLARDTPVARELERMRAVLSPTPASALDHDAVLAIADQRDVPPRLRRLAQWRSGNTDPARLAALDALPRESTALDHVTRALLAEHDADPAAVRDAWLRSLDDDDRIAAALLTALAGLDPAPCEVAAQRTLDPELAMLFRAASGGADRDQRERWLRGWTPDDRATRVVALFIATADGDARLFSLLTDPHPADAAARLVAIERLVPAWVDHLGPPASAETDDIMEHLARLDALRRLTAGSLAYDRASRRYTVRGLPLPDPVERE